MSILQKDRGDTGLAMAAAEEAMPLLVHRNSGNGNGHSHNGNGVVAHRLVSPDEYLRVENAALDKSEYIRGRIYPMPGARPEHDTIAGNIFGELYLQVKRSAVRVHTSDLRVQIRERGASVDFFYPDATVVCEPPQYNGRHLLNPTLVVEVFSKSTEVYDQTKKFDEYKLIESLREVVFVAQEKPYVARHVRDDGGNWRGIKEVTEMDAQVTLLDNVSIGSGQGCLLSLLDIYKDVDFDLPEEDTEPEAQP